MKFNFRVRKITKKTVTGDVSSGQLTNVQSQIDQISSRVSANEDEIIADDATESALTTRVTSLETSQTDQATEIEDLISALNNPQNTTQYVAGQSATVTATAAGTVTSSSTLFTLTNNHTTGDGWDIEFYHATYTSAAWSNAATVLAPSSTPIQVRAVLTGTSTPLSASTTPRLLGWTGIFSGGITISGAVGNPGATNGGNSSDVNGKWDKQTSLIAGKSHWVHETSSYTLTWSSLYTAWVIATPAGHFAFNSYGVDDIPNAYEVSSWVAYTAHGWSGTLAFGLDEGNLTGPVHGTVTMPSSNTSVGANITSTNGEEMVYSVASDTDDGVFTAGTFRGKVTVTISGWTNTFGGSGLPMVDAFYRLDGWHDDNSTYHPSSKSNYKMQMNWGSPGQTADSYWDYPLGDGANNSDSGYPAINWSPASTPGNQSAENAIIGTSGNRNAPAEGTNEYTFTMDLADGDKAGSSTTDIRLGFRTWAGQPSGWTQGLGGYWIKVEPVSGQGTWTPPS